MLSYTNNKSNKSNNNDNHFVRYTNEINTVQF